ncbi:MAG: hypothetical protein HYU99_03075 [Deltaproteobacteria bacterium]|nr:hypothetical protein [Deltaproteobacteria bacterium]
MPRNLTIIPLGKALSFLKRGRHEEALCYFLVDDYVRWTKLRDGIGSKIQPRNLSGIFDQTLQEIKEPLLELLAQINIEFGSQDWWSNNVSSRNVASTPLILNVVFLFAAKKILGMSSSNLIFITKSLSLSMGIEKFARARGYEVENEWGWADKIWARAQPRLNNLAKCAYYLWECFRFHRATKKFLRPLPIRKKSDGKRILLRSWVTLGNFGKDGRFSDRNFGSLPAWLRSKGFEVWTLPMFFNIPMGKKKLLMLLGGQNDKFLVPYHYLGFVDYLEALWRALRETGKTVKRAELDKTDIAPLYNEALKGDLSPSLLVMNLCSPLLKKLKEQNCEIDRFFYAFENNAPEKPFILSCRKYFPDSRIIAFQHTTFFPNQLAYHLAPREWRRHPLPDKIICSGPAYSRLFRNAGFPPDMLFKGPSLRYRTASATEPPAPKGSTMKEKMLLVSLPGEPNPSKAFELIDKTSRAFKPLAEYKVYFRNHPVLPRKKVIEFLRRTGMNRYEFADEGKIQDWLPGAHALITIGLSITVLEGAAMGIPVLRVIPDNSFFFDPMAATAYPLAPINTPEEMRDQLLTINSRLKDDPECFRKIGEQVLQDYFTEPTGETMDVFIEDEDGFGPFYGKVQTHMTLDMPH